MKKRVVALLMALCLTLSAAPAFALDADGEEAVSVTVQDDAAVTTEEPAAPEEPEESAVLEPNEVHVTAGESKIVRLSAAEDSISSCESSDPAVATATVSAADAVEILGVAAGECTVTVVTANGVTLECPVTVSAAVPKEGTLDAASISLKGKEAVHLGNNIYMHATVTGLGGTLTGARVNWYLNGTRVSSQKNVKIKEGQVLDLKTKLSKKTTRKNNKVTIKVSKDGVTVSQSATVQSIFDFVGAKLKVSKRSHVTVGDSMKVTMTVSGLQETIKGSYLWYVDNKKVGERTAKTIKNGSTFTYTYKPSKSGKHDIKLVLKNAEGNRVLKKTKTVTVHKKYAKTLASYTTNFDSGNVNRSTNVRLAAKSIDGTVIKPGKTFSFNKVVGERTAEAGYKQAIVFEGGQPVPGLGGGVCQVSSTLFNAALLSNMKISERHYHSATVSYVPLGRDATVAYGSKDFKFTNNLDTPIKIDTVYSSNGSLTMKIRANYGTSIPKVKLSVSRSGGGYCLKRYANDKLNYTTYSYY